MFSGENDMAKSVWTDTAKQGYISDELRQLPRTWKRRSGRPLSKLLGVFLRLTVVVCSLAEAGEVTIGFWLRKKKHVAFDQIEPVTSEGVFPRRAQRKPVEKQHWDSILGASHLGLKY